MGGFSVDSTPGPGRCLNLSSSSTVPDRSVPVREGKSVVVEDKSVRPPIILGRSWDSLEGPTSESEGPRSSTPESFVTGPTRPKTGFDSTGVQGTSTSRLREPGSHILSSNWTTRRTPSPRTETSVVIGKEPPFGVPESSGSRGPN